MIGFRIGGCWLLAVRAVGLLKLPTFIPILAELLARDEDLLLEEVAEALIRYQSDEVVKAVKPFAMQHETFIFTLSVLETQKLIMRKWFSSIAMILLMKMERAGSLKA